MDLCHAVQSTPGCMSNVMFQLCRGRRENCMWWKSRVTIGDWLTEVNSLPESAPLSPLCWTSNNSTVSHCAYWALHSLPLKLMTHHGFRLSRSHPDTVGWLKLKQETRCGETFSVIFQGLHTILPPPDLWLWVLALGIFHNSKICFIWY